MIAESAIDGELAQTRRDSAAAALDNQARLARTQAELIEIARRKAGLRIAGAEKGLEALEVRAPHAGIFLRARFGPDRLEPGTEMWQGMPIGELPLAGALQAEVYVLEADAGGLAAGQEAEVRIEAQPDTRLARQSHAPRRRRAAPLPRLAGAILRRSPWASTDGA